MQYIVDSSHGGKQLAPRREEFDRVALVFTRMGGEWAKLFRGSGRDMNLLKKTINVAVENGIFSTLPTWGE